MRGYREYRIGNLFVIHLSLGQFRLDGGAMFGVVPKTLWSRSVEADRRNRIPMGTNVLLVETEEGWLLVDTGIGDKWERREREIYGVETKDPWPQLGISREDIRYVVLTHLHFDHAGGATVKSEGKILPAYPNATYFVQEKEWEDATNPNERTRASYRPQDFTPLEERVVLLKGDSEIVKGIRVEHTGGHTRGHEIVILESKKERGCFLGDIIPTVNHMRLPYIMAYDNFPLVTLEKKKAIYERALKERWLLFFEHDKTPRAGYIELGPKGFGLKEK